MTNFDLEHIYELLSLIRSNTKSQKSLQYCNDVLLSLGTEGKETIKIREISERYKTGFGGSYEYSFIAKGQKEQLILDENVYVYFRKIFLEIKYLFLTERNARIFDLIDYTDNVPKAIINNNLELPFDYLKKCLKKYWKKHDKSFLHDFIRKNYKKSSLPHDFY